MRSLFVILTPLMLLMALPSFAQMTCGARSASDAATFASCVSEYYNPPLSMIDGAPSTGDEYSRLQWPMRMILEGDSYSTVLGDAPRDVKVAVIDTYPGHQNHPDLINKYETGINLVEGGTNTNPPTWDGLAGGNAHGQCVASVIAAEHNTVGVAGVFSRARIIPIRASFNTLDLAINAAVAAGAEVIHIAGWEIDFTLQDYAMYPDIGLPTTPPLRWMMKDPTTAAYEIARLQAIREAVESAVFDHNVIISTVVGNWDGRTTTHFLSGMHETISTMAVNIKGEPSAFNSTSHSAVMLAPGGERKERAWSLAGIIGTEVFGPTYDANPDDVMCATGPNKYSWGSGGSFAGPHIAAAVAMIKSYLPNATAQDVRRLLVRSAQPLTLTNLHLLSANPGKMLSLKRLKIAIMAEL